MDLRDFLGYFDFDYDIVSPGEKREDRIRRELVEDGKLTEQDLDKDLICLIDLQGAYFGGIGNERFPIAADSSGKIVERMGIYVQESVYDEFTDALEARGIESGGLSLEEMIAKCRELGVDSGEVCYPLAEAVAKPESISIYEVVRMEKKEHCRTVVIPGLMKDGVTLEQVQEELDYRERAGVVEPHAGWDDDLIDYTTEELEIAEALWHTVEREQTSGQDLFAAGLAKQLRNLMGDLIENGDGFWEDLSIRLPIVKEGLDGYGMVIKAVEDDARDQFFEVGLYKGFSEKDNGIQILSEYTESDDLNELEAVMKEVLVHVSSRLEKMEQNFEKEDLNLGVRIFGDSRESCDQYGEVLKLWSNGLGELHDPAKGDIGRAELPEELKRVYDELYWEPTSGASSRYFVETDKGYGIALVNEYDTVTAASSGMAFINLFDTVIEDAKGIAKEPMFAKFEIFAGECLGFDGCHELVVVIPWDTPVEEYVQAAKKLDEYVYVACGLNKSIASVSFEEKLEQAKDESVRFVTDTVVSAPGLDKAAKVRDAALDAVHKIPGYEKLPLKDKNALYDLAKKAVELSMEPVKDFGF